jgi:hypothetical protein
MHMHHASCMCVGKYLSFLHEIKRGRLTWNRLTYLEVVIPINVSYEADMDGINRKRKLCPQVVDQSAVNHVL